MVFLYVYVWFRATLPRLRYDQLMDLGWKVLIPVGLGWFMLLVAAANRQRPGLEPIGKTIVGVISSCSSWPRRRLADAGQHGSVPATAKREGAMY